MTYLWKFLTKDTKVSLLGHATSQKMVQLYKRNTSGLLTVLVDTTTFNPVISFNFWLQEHIAPLSLNIDEG